MVERGKVCAESALSAHGLGTRSPNSQFSDLPIFTDVDQPLVDRLLERCTTRQYEPGALIVGQGNQTPALHIIRRGIVDLTHLSGRSECGVLLLSSKDLLLPATTLFREPALVSARALTKTRVLLLEADAVELALGQSRAFAANLMRAMSGQWRMAVRNILDLNCRTAAQRIGAFLLRVADLQSDSASPVLPIAKRHLAVRLGIQPETLSRMLQTLADHGLYVRGRTIVIRDRAAIEEFCGPDPYPVRDEQSLDVFAL
jgi:CRP-like cAMP-binding protein